MFNKIRLLQIAIIQLQAHFAAHQRSEAFNGVFHLGLHTEQAGRVARYLCPLWGHGCPVRQKTQIF